MEDIRIDTHKLIFHPHTVSRWLAIGDNFPISLEVGLSSACNHRCVFCALDYTHFKPAYLDKTVLFENLKLLIKNGTRSVVYAGEGEPLLHKHFKEIIIKTKEIGLDIGLSTNGMLFNKDISDSCLQAFTWVRFSLNAGTEELYDKIHNPSKGGFNDVLQNIAYAVAVKKENRLNTTIGVQSLLLNENINEMLALAVKLKEIGADYFTIKPYSQNPNSINKFKDTMDYSNLSWLENQLKALNTDNFKTYFRSHTMSNLNVERSYSVCHGIDFFMNIDASGNAMPCILFLGNDKFYYGNLYEKNIEEIWNNRHAVTDKLKDMGIANCREICRLHEINKYLHELKNPGLHVNFI